MTVSEFQGADAELTLRLKISSEFDKMENIQSGFRKK
jgi:hypothetical protein